MAYTLVLGLHIITALVTVGVIVGALYALVGAQANQFPFYAWSIGVLALFEIVSGTLLTILSPDIALTEFVSHIIAYLIVCIAVELLLYMQVRRVVWIS